MIFSPQGGDSSPVITVAPTGRAGSLQFSVLSACGDPDEPGRVWRPFDRPAASRAGRVCEAASSRRRGSHRKATKSVAMGAFDCRHMMTRSKFRGHKARSVPARHLRGGPYTLGATVPCGIREVSP